MEMTRNLRKGYTTGTCAAAAAKAATRMLLKGTPIESVDILLPNGQSLMLLLSDQRISGAEATCSVIKDSGDDPDVTNQMRIFATVRKTASQGVQISGGSGIGVVTKPGLSIPVGSPAINPVPLDMIRREVGVVCQENNYHFGLDVKIFAPDGEEIAKKTYNPRLGILGGISILGTTGIVNPMSEEALIKTIKLELAQKIEVSGKSIIACPGNYGEAFINGKLRLAYQPVLCSNYIGEFLDECKNKGIDRLLLVGHAGKLVKLAAGIMNTHSKMADGRMEILAAHAAAEGANAQLIEAILASNTTEDAVSQLETVQALEGRVFQRVVEKILEHVGYRVNHEFEVGVILFNNLQEIVGQSDNAMEMLQWFPPQNENMCQAWAERDGERLRGTLYGVGVGPGDPELLTLKAIRHIQSADIIAVPDTRGEEQTALQIASQVVDLSEKERYLAFMPMTKDKSILEKSHEMVALDIGAFLEQGKNVAFLTLGDPSIYSTYCYIHERTLAKGYHAKIIPGVTSFSAVAARLNHGLCEGDEPLHILPASYKGTEEYFKWKGTKILMKSGKEFGYLRERLKESGLLPETKMVSRCGMANELVYENIEEADENASYFSIIVIKENNI